MSGTSEKNSPDIRQYLLTFAFQPTEFWTRKFVDFSCDQRNSKRFKDINEEKAQVIKQEAEYFNRGEVKEEIDNKFDASLTSQTLEETKDEKNQFIQETRNCSKTVQDKSSDEKFIKKQSKTPLKGSVIPSFLVSKNHQKQFEVYTCFPCFLSGSENSMWNESQQYLAHMSLLHKGCPDFQEILKKNVKNNFHGSHLFFKGKLTNIFSNSQYQKEFKLYYQLKNKLFSQLYFCNCEISESIDLRRFTSKIFNSEKDYIVHLKRHFDKKNKFFSHYQTQYGSKMFLKKNPNFDSSLQLKKIQRCEAILKEIVNSRINSLSIAKLLQKIPMNVLEIISCNPGLIPPEKASVYFPQCQNCNKIFQDLSYLCRHRAKEYQQARYHNRYQVSKDDLKRLGVVRKKNCKITISNLFQLTEDEYLMLDSQLFLYKYNKYAGSWKAMICGHCKAVFPRNNTDRPYFDYLLHIYREHQTLHPLNSHYIRFVQKLPREMQEEDQEEDED